MVSSYTANLAAFLTVESKFYAIKSVQDLANNPYGVTYGAKKGGATFGFFKVKVLSIYCFFILECIFWVLLSFINLLVMFIYWLFQESDNLLYQKMYEYMDSHPELQTATNDEGLERYSRVKIYLLISSTINNLLFFAGWNQMTKIMHF